MIGKYQLLDAMQKLADSDAAKLKKKLQLAIQKHSPKRIIVLAHLPPFRESCMHEGKISNDDYLPFFASKTTGDTLYKPLDNLTVKSGSVEYGKPIVQMDEFYFSIQNDKSMRYPNALLRGLLNTVNELKL